MEVFFLPKRSDTTGERECVNGLLKVGMWEASFVVLVGSTSVENCLCVANLAGDEVVE